MASSRTLRALAALTVTATAFGAVIASGSGASATEAADKGKGETITQFQTMTLPGKLAFPDADLYQMLAYCTALRLPVGHLVYASGNEVGRAVRVHGADVLILAHTLDLASSPAALLAQVDEVAERTQAAMSLRPAHT